MNAKPLHVPFAPTSGGGQPASPPKATAGKYSTGVLCCIVATLSFGIMFPVMTSALTRIDPFTFTTLRYLTAGFAFLVLLLAKEGSVGLRLERKAIFLAWVFGSIGFAGFGFLVFLGQQIGGKDGALTASIMMATQPMLGLLLNAVAKRIRPPFYSFLFILMSFCGVALVVTKGDIVGLIHEPQNYSANVLILLGACCWVIYTFGAGFFPRWSTLTYTTVTIWLGLISIITINVVLFALHAIAVPSISDLAAIIPHLLYMGPIAGFIGVLCWNMGNRILSPMNGVLFMDLVPITTFAASALEGVVPGRLQIIGACVTGTALIFNNLYLRFRSRQSP